MRKVCFAFPISQIIWPHGVFDGNRLGAGRIKHGIQTWLGNGRRIDYEHAVLLAADFAKVQGYVPLNSQLSGLGQKWRSYPMSPLDQCFYFSKVGKERRTFRSVGDSPDATELPISDAGSLRNSPY